MNTLIPHGQTILGLDRQEDMYDMKKSTKARHT